jgi:NDP-sugar pyrophosphorylase family protein
VVAAQANEAGRYGGMDIDRFSRVTRFREKDDGEKKPPHLVSAGVYLSSAGLLDEIAALRRGSLEHDVFERQPAGTILAFPIDGHFLDIGTPQTLAVAAGAGWGSGARL